MVDPWPATGGTWLGHRAKGLGVWGSNSVPVQANVVFGFPKWVPASAGSEYANLVDAVQQAESGLE